MYYFYEYADVFLEHMWKILFACQRPSQENSCANLFKESIHQDIIILGEQKDTSRYKSETAFWVCMSSGGTLVWGSLFQPLVNMNNCFVSG